MQSFESDAQLFTIVVWNYREYHSLLDRYLDAYILKEKDYFEKWPIYQNVNRVALNYLSSVRTYLDHTETSLNRRFGNTSGIFKDFVSSCNQAYDSFFSYRFLYKLRDYAQHCGFPIGNITLNVKPKDGDIERPIYSMEISANRDALLSGFDWKKLKAEVQSQPQKININAHIDTLMECLSNINEKVTKSVFSTLFDAATYIKELLLKAPLEDGTPGVFQLEVKEVNDGKPTDIKQIKGSPIPMDLVNAVLSGKLDDVVTEIKIEHR